MNQNLHQWKVMPAFLYEVFQDRTNKNIAVTQPRVLTAINIAECCHNIINS